MPVKRHYNFVITLFIGLIGLMGIVSLIIVGLDLIQDSKNIDQIVHLSSSATSSATRTPSSTPTPTSSTTRTPSSTPTPTSSTTRTPSSSPTPTSSATRTPSSTPTPTSSATRTPSSTPTPTSSATPTVDFTATLDTKATVVADLTRRAEQTQEFLVSSTVAFYAQQTKEALYTPTPATMPVSGTLAFSKRLIIEITSIEHNQYSGSSLGIKINSRVDAIGYQYVPIRVGIFLYYADDTPVLGSSAPTEYQSPDGALTIQKQLNPSYEASLWEDLEFFLPYEYFPRGLIGTQNMYIQAYIGLDGQILSIPSNAMSFQYFPPAKQIIVDLISIELDATVPDVNEEVILVTYRVRAIGYQDVPIRVGLFFYWNDDTPISGENAGNNQTLEGHLTLQRDLTPSDSDTVWESLTSWISYDAFPPKLRGDYDAYVVAYSGASSAPTLEIRSTNQLYFRLIYL